MKIVFIAGQYIGNGNIDQIQWNILKAEKYQISLANSGIGFFCPHNHTRHFEKKSTAPEKFYKELDMTFLKCCADAILMIPGWEKSVGAKTEHDYAKESFIKIFYPKNPDDLDEIIKWANSDER